MNVENGLQIGDICLLYMARVLNANSNKLDDELQRMEQSKDKKILRKDYFIFDYYDKLVCIKGEGIPSSAYLGIGHQRADLAVSEQYMTLVSPDHMEQDPLFYGQPGTPTTLPFFAMIQVSIVPKPGKSEEGEGAASDISEEQINQFLQECASQLSQKVEGISKEYAEYQYISRIFYSMNVCNFCLIIRGNQLDPIHKIGMKIREEGLCFERSEGIPFPDMQCSTFTIMGLEKEVLYDTEGQIQGYVKDSESEIVLRLVLDDKTLRNDKWEQLSGIFTKAGGTIVKGLYGRYDLSMQLSVTDFLKIFPLLYQYKFNGHSSGTEKELNAMKVKYAGNAKLTTILQIIEKNVLHSLNERLLVSLGYSSAPFPKTKTGQCGKDESILCAINGEENCSEAAEQEMTAGETTGQVSGKKQELERDSLIKKQNKKIDDDLGDLKGGLNSTYNEYPYERCIQILTDIWGEFKNLRFQSDSFLNGNLFYLQFDYLCEIIRKRRKELNELADTKDIELRESSYQDFIACLRILLRKLHDFHKLLQAVNYQSFQAPLLELQMKTDVEKYVLAYTEFSEMLSNAIHDYLARDSSMEKPQKIQQIFTVDSLLSLIEARPLFLAPYRRKEEGIYLARDDEKILLSVSVPGIDYFAKLYQMLPPLVHELSHNYRIIERRKRNHALLNYILGQCARYMVHQWIALGDREERYISAGLLEQKLLIDPVKEALITAFLKDYKSQMSQYNIGALLSNIDMFFLNKVLYDENEMYFQNISESKDKQIDEAMKTLVSCLQSYTIVPENIKPASDRILTVKEIKLWFQKGSACYHSKLVLAKVVRRLCIERLGQMRDLLEELFHSASDKRFKKKLQKTCENLDWLFTIEVDKLDQKNSNRRLKSVRKAEQELFEWEISDCTGFDEYITSFYQKFSGFYTLFTRVTGMKAKRCCEISSRKVDEVNLSIFIKEIEDCCKSLKDYNVLYNEISRLMERSNTDENTREREAIVTSIKEKVQGAYHTKMCLAREASCQPPVNPEQRIGHILFGAKQIQRMMTPLEITIETGTEFEENLKKVLYTLPFDRMKVIVSKAAQLYRECFADLGMCAALSLDCFGYLKVLAAHEEIIKHDFLEERIRYVCGTIKKYEPCGGTTGNGVREKKEEMMDTALQYIEELGVDFPAQLDIRRQLETLTPERIESFADKEKLDECQDILFSAETSSAGKIRRISNLLRLLSVTYRMDEGQCDQALLKHFKMLFQERLYDEENKRCCYEQGRQVFISCCKSVGEEYNKRSKSDKTPDEYYKDTLSFVLYYYYHSLHSYYNKFENERNVREGEASADGK